MTVLRLHLVLQKEAFVSWGRNAGPAGVARNCAMHMMKMPCEKSQLRTSYVQEYSTNRRDSQLSRFLVSPCSNAAHGGLTNRGPLLTRFPGDRDFDGDLRSGQYKLNCKTVLAEGRLRSTAMGSSQENLAPAPASNSEAVQEACSASVTMSTTSPASRQPILSRSPTNLMWHRGVLELLCSSCRYVVRRWHVPILGVDCNANPRHKQALTSPPPRSRGIPKYLVPYLVGKQAPRHPRWRQDHMIRARATHFYRAGVRRNG